MAYENGGCDENVIFPESVTQWLAAHGATGILFANEVKEMKRASARVFLLLSDREWHSAAEVRQVAGRNGHPASEGLRRLRDLRKVLGKHGLEIVHQRLADSALFYYRLQSIQAN